MLTRARIPTELQISARTRAIGAFVAFGLGIVLALQLTAEPALWFSLACSAAGAVFLAGRTASTLALLAALFALGGAAASVHLGPWPTESIAHHLPKADEAPMMIEVEGIALHAPELVAPPTGALAAHIPDFMRQTGSMRFDLALSRVRTGDSWTDASGVMTVWIDLRDGPHAPAIRGGDPLRLTGAATTSRQARNPGERDWSLANRDRGRAGSIGTSPELIEPAPKSGGLSRAASLLLHWRSSIQSRASAIIDRAIAGDSAAAPVVRGLLLGRRGADERDVTGAFRRVGLVHLLAVSGFHVAVAAGLALIAIRLTGDRGWVEPLVVCLALGLYVLLVPMRAPIFRAAMIVLVVLASDALGRRHDRLTLVAWLAIIWLAVRPSDLFDLGFQLSFGLTAWLMLLAEPRRDALPDLDSESRWSVLSWMIKSPLRATAACWSLALPVIAYHVGIISPLAIVATLITVPLIIASMWTGFLVLVFGALAPQLAWLFAGILRAVAGGAARVALWFDSLPGATITLREVSPLWAVFSVGAIAWIWRRGTLRDWTWPALLAAVLLWLGAEQWAGSRVEGEAEIHMLDVGNATAMLVRTDDASLLWDCGSWRPDVGRTLIPEACRSLGETSIDTIVITHANIDHFMGVLDAVRTLGVDRVVTGESFLLAAQADPEGAPAHVLAELERLGVSHRVVARGDEIDLGKMTLRVLHPTDGFKPRAENDASLVAALVDDKGHTHALLTGDIQQEAMAILMVSGEDLGAPVMELPHHGSAHDAAYAFTQTVDPKVVLQSTGRMRLDDPRWEEVRRGRVWMTSARTGAVSVILHEDGRVSVRPAR